MCSGRRDVVPMVGNPQVDRSGLGRSLAVMTELVPTGGPPAASVENQLAAFEEGLLEALGTLGLPTEGVFVDFEQRRRAFRNFPDAVDLLAPANRGRAVYLSKFLAAVGAGLFDAALNYLWDETVTELRRRIVAYDLAYFFDIAVPSPDRRKALKGEDDLGRVEDQELIRAAREIGLVSDVGYQQLDLIRFMRNHASAAHPNQNDITALQLMGWVETCIKEVITLPESTAVAETRRLLANVRSGQISTSNASATSEFFGDLLPVQADNIGAGLFGIYVEPNSAEPARDGVRLLLPLLWPLVGEDQRQQFGARYGRFVANGDADQARLARELLDVVGAAAYLPEPVRVAELAAAIDELLTAHRGFNNFHNEPGPARRLNNLAGDKVPDAVRAPYVAALVEVFLTNGNGVAWNADSYYQQMIGRFSPEEAEGALRRLVDPTVASQLRWDQARLKYAELLDLLDPKVTRPVVRELFDAIRTFNGTPSDLGKDSNLKRLYGRIG